MKSFVWNMILVSFCFTSAVSLADEGAGNQLVAKYKNIEVTQDDVKRYVAFRVPSERRAEYLGSEELLLKVVENIVTVRSLAARAVDADEDQLRWQAEFERQNWLSQLAQSQATAQALATANWEAQAKEAYIAEPDKYVIPARVEAAHILISTRDRSREEALARVQEVRQKLIAGGDFGELAVQYSDDPSAEKNRGELGAFTANRMVKPFANAAFSMKEPGSISEPVETDFGYHLIKFHKAHPAERRPFERVKDGIIKNLHGTVAARAREQLLTEARSLHGIELHKEAITQIVNSSK